MKLKLLIIPAVVALTGCKVNVLKQADYEFNQMRYSKSAKLYEKHLASNKNDTKTREKLAQTYLNMKDYKQAEIEYMKIVTRPDVSSTAILNYAKVLNLVGKADIAKDWMEIYLSKHADDPVAQSYITNLKDTKEMEKDSGQIRMDQVVLKDQACAFSCAKYKNGIVFTAAATSSEVKEKDPWTGNSFYNLYYSEQNKDGEWTKPKALQGDLNKQYHESTPLFSKNGDEILFTRSDYTNKKLNKNKEDVSNLKLFSAKLINDEWKEIKELPFNSADFSNGHPAYYGKESAIIFISDRKGGYGGTDLYISYKTTEGYSEPLNLGPEVNTAGNEMFPWYNELDSSLYFSSEGHLNIGGLDVYKTKHNGKTWEKPINLGFPINSHADDFSYILNEDKKTGFVSSNRFGSDQIFTFKEIPIKVKILGKIRVKFNGEELPLAEVFIEVTNKITGVKRRYSSGLDGDYHIELEPEMEYKIFATKDNYYSTKPIEINTRGLKKSQNIIADFELEKIELEKPIVVNNMYYDLGKWDIKPEAKEVLDGLVKFMNENPGITIELSSHTDSRASDKYNLTLSEKRAKSAVAYMITKGIDATRLNYKGYGETKLLNKCSNGVKCNEEEHSLNRRTEFKVIKVEKVETNPFGEME